MKIFTKTLRAILTAALLITLAGCASLPQTLPEPPRKTAKVAVISFMGNKAEVSDVKTIAGHHKVITLSQLALDSKISRSTVRTLKALGYKRATVLTPPRNNPITQATRLGQVFAFTTSAAKAAGYIKHLTRPGQYEYIVAIVPIVNKDLIESSRLFRYGVARRNQLFLSKKTYFYAACRLVIYNGDNYKELAAQHLFPTKDVSRLNWSRLPNLSAQNADELRTWLSTVVAGDVKRNVVNMIR